jgi:hypothetical protein
MRDDGTPITPAAAVAAARREARAVSRVFDAGLRLANRRRSAATFWCVRRTCSKKMLRAKAAVHVGASIAVLLVVLVGARWCFVHTRGVAGARARR